VGQLAQLAGGSAADGIGVARLEPPRAVALRPELDGHPQHASPAEVKLGVIPADLEVTADAAGGVAPAAGHPGPLRAFGLEVPANLLCGPDCDSTVPRAITGDASASSTSTTAQSTAQGPKWQMRAAITV
jgi:hypothetical protein